MKNIIINFFDKNIKHLAITFCLLMSLFIFRSLVINPTNYILDQYDYPYYVWTVNEVIESLTYLDFANFFDGNIFYPNKGTLLFSDLLIPQASIGLIIKLLLPQSFNQNNLLIFNLVFLATILLNILCIFRFWEKVFKDKYDFILASILFSFNSFLFIQLSHFQMITYWPFFLFFSVIFEEKSNYKNHLLLGLIITIQFLASVYLAIFLLTSYVIKLFLDLIYSPQIKSFVKKDAKFHIITLLVFFISSSPFLYKYISNKKLYEMTREYGEYITYSAHITDYLFTSGYQGIISNTQLIRKWNGYNHHNIGEMAINPSFTLTLVSILGILNFSSNVNYFSFFIHKNKSNLFFLSLLLIGLFFSLGPRLSVNGIYAHIPLPYTVLLKFFPLLEPIRGTSRWSFLFYIAIIYFSVIGMNKIAKNNKIVVMLIIIIFYFLELIPLNSKGSVYIVDTLSYENIKKECQFDKKVLLELPFNQEFEDANVATNLSYKSKIMYSSMYHKCNIVNGYAGFDPKDIINFEKNINNTIKYNKQQEFESLISGRNVEIIKVNKKNLFNEQEIKLISILKNIENRAIITENENYLIMKVYD